jgi:hypothetical protein
MAGPECWSNHEFSSRFMHPRMSIMRQSNNSMILQI